MVSPREDPGSVSDVPGAGEPDLPGLPWPAFVSAAPDLSLSVLYLVAWIAPQSLPSGLPRDLVLIMVLEFIIIHSSAFMGITAYQDAPRAKKVRMLVYLAFLYTLFVGGFSLAFRTLWPMLSFWLLTANRLLGVLIGQAPKGREAAMVRKGWAVSAISYLGFTFLTLLLPLPRFGITSSVVASMDLTRHASGLWIDQPWRTLALGFLYFAMVGISELAGHAWIRDRDIPALRDRSAA